MYLHLYCLSYIWPFDNNHYADVAIGGTEFDTPALKYPAGLMFVSRKYLIRWSQVTEELPLCCVAFCDSHSRFTNPVTFKYV